MRRFNIKLFINRIKTIIDYIPITWQDSDYSFDFAYGLLYKKLSRMEKVWQDDKQQFAYVGQKRDLKDIQIAKNLCKRLYENKYLDNAMFWHNKKYGDYIHDLDFISKEANENGNYLYVGDTNKVRERGFSRCCKHANKMAKSDRDYLMDLMKKKSVKWWI